MPTATAERIATDDAATTESVEEVSTELSNLVDKLGIAEVPASSRSSRDAPSARSANPAAQSPTSPSV